MAGLAPSTELPLWPLEFLNSPVADGHQKNSGRFVCCSCKRVCFLRIVAGRQILFVNNHTHPAERGLRYASADRVQDGRSRLRELAGWLCCKKRCRDLGGCKKSFLRKMAQTVTFLNIFHRRRKYKQLWFIFQKLCKWKIFAAFLEKG